MREDEVVEIKEDEVAVEVTVKKKSQTANKKEVGSAGRKKVSANQKKKARQVFYSEDEFSEIVECAEFLCIDPKTFMEMGIKKLIKHTQDEIKEIKEAN